MGNDINVLSLFFCLYIFFVSVCIWLGCIKLYREMSKWISLAYLNLRIGKFSSAFSFIRSRFPSALLFYPLYYLRGQIPLEPIEWIWYLIMIHFPFFFIFDFMFFFFHCYCCFCVLVHFRV